MDILTAILACSLYADDNLVRAIVQSTSQSNPYSVIDSGAEPGVDEPPPPAPRTPEEALTRMNEIAERGGAPLLGLMQVPPSWAGLFGREPRDLFDPCINISIGTARISEFDHECSAQAKLRPAWPRKRRRTKLIPSAMENRPCVLRKYAETIGMPDFAVVTSFELDQQKSKALVARASEGPIFYAAVAERTWGTDRIFFQTSTAEISKERPRSADGEKTQRTTGRQ